MVPGSTFKYGSHFWRVTRRPRLSRRQPIDAAATPLPREETTPPVTEIYFGPIRSVPALRNSGLQNWVSASVKSRRTTHCTRNSKDCQRTDDCAKRFLSRAIASRQFPRFSVVAFAREQVAHDFDAVVAGVVQARQAEAAFDRLEQREMRVAPSALHTVDAVVRIHGQQHLIHVGRGAVIVLVPEDDDGVVAFLPDRRSIDRFHDVPDGKVAEI